MVKLPENVLAHGRTRNIMRETFEYGNKRKAQVGSDKVYDYSLGNPSVAPPRSVNDTVRDILSGELSDSIHAYTSAQGAYDNRKRLADSLQRRFGGNVSPDDLYFTVGAAAALTITFKALTVPDNEFILLAPFFSEYEVFLQNAGAKAVICQPDYKDFMPDFEAIEKAININTKGIVINSPNNPSGVVYDGAVIARLSELLRKKSEEIGHPIFLINDEPYREIVFDGKRAPWVPDFYDNTIVCYSYSKSLSIPGERIGYIYVPERVCGHDDVYAAVCGAGRMLGFVNAPSLFQKVVSICDGQTADMSVYERNRDLLYNSLVEMGFDCIRPGGTFYLLMKSPIENATEFCLSARKYDLLIVPTDSFRCPGYVRIAFCVETKTIENSLPLFAKLAADYNLG